MKKNFIALATTGALAALTLAGCKTAQKGDSDFGNDFTAADLHAVNYGSDLIDIARSPASGEQVIVRAARLIKEAEMVKGVKKLSPEADLLKALNRDTDPSIVAFKKKKGGMIEMKDLDQIDQLAQQRAVSRYLAINSKKFAKFDELSANVNRQTLLLTEGKGLNKGGESLVSRNQDALERLKKAVNSNDQAGKSAAIKEITNTIGDSIFDAIKELGKDPVFNTAEGRQVRKELLLHLRDIKKRTDISMATKDGCLNLHGDLDAFKTWNNILADFDETVARTGKVDSSGRTICNNVSDVLLGVAASFQQARLGRTLASEAVTSAKGLHSCGFVSDRILEGKVKTDKSGKIIVPSCE